MPNKYKNPDAPAFSSNDAVHIGIKLKKLARYMGVYSISFQFWGDGNNNVYIEKGDVELYSGGGYDTPLAAVGRALEYLERINPSLKTHTNPNF